MTALKCQRCQSWWSIATQHPDQFSVISRFCPNCIPLVAPPMGNVPFTKKAVA